MTCTTPLAAKTRVFALAVMASVQVEDVDELVVEEALIGPHRHFNGRTGGRAEQLAGAVALLVLRLGHRKRRRFRGQLGSRLREGWVDEDRRRQRVPEKEIAAEQ